MSLETQTGVSVGRAIELRKTQQQDADSPSAFDPIHLVRRAEKTGGLGIWPNSDVVFQECRGNFPTKFQLAGKEISSEENF